MDLSEQVDVLAILSRLFVVLIPVNGEEVGIVPGIIPFSKHGFLLQS